MTSEVQRALTRCFWLLDRYRTKAIVAESSELPLIVDELQDFVAGVLSNEGVLNARTTAAKVTQLVIEARSAASNLPTDLEAALVEIERIVQRGQRPRLP